VVVQLQDPKFNPQYRQKKIFWFFLSDYFSYFTQRIFFLSVLGWSSQYMVCPFQYVFSNMYIWNFRYAFLTLNYIFLSSCFNFFPSGFLLYVFMLDLLHLSFTFEIFCYKSFCIFFSFWFLMFFLFLSFISFQMLSVGFI
jgi:hypothetical protein